MIYIFLFKINGVDISDAIAADNSNEAFDLLLKKHERATEAQIVMAYQ